MAGTSAGAAKRKRCPRCGQWHGPERSCGRPGPKARLTPEQRRANAAAYARQWRADHPESVALYSARYADHQRAERFRLRVETLSAYTDAEDGVPVCTCCGERELVFLTLDHVGGGGNMDRRANGHNGGTSTYRRLRTAGYPPGYRVLCWNCNAAFALLGACPHA